MTTEHRLAQYRQSESRAVVLCVCGKAWSGPTMESVWDRFTAHQINPLAPSSAEGTPNQ